MLRFFGPYLRSNADLPDGPKAFPNRIQKRHFPPLQMSSCFGSVPPSATRIVTFFYHKTKSLPGAIKPLRSFILAPSGILVSWHPPEGHLYFGSQPYWIPLYTTGGVKWQVSNGGYVGRLFPAEAFISRCIRHSRPDADHAMFLSEIITHSNHLSSRINQHLTISQLPRLSHRAIHLGGANSRLWYGKWKPCQVGRRALARFLYNSEFKRNTIMSRERFSPYVGIYGSVILEEIGAVNLSVMKFGVWGCLIDWVRQKWRTPTWCVFAFRRKILVDLITKI